MQRFTEITELMAEVRRWVITIFVIIIVITVGIPAVKVLLFAEEAANGLIQWVIDWWNG